MLLDLACVIIAIWCAWIVSVVPSRGSLVGCRRSKERRRACFTPGLSPLESVESQPLGFLSFCQNMEETTRKRVLATSTTVKDGYGRPELPATSLVRAALGQDPISFGRFGKWRVYAKERMGNICDALVQERARSP